MRENYCPAPTYTGAGVVLICHFHNTLSKRAFFPAPTEPLLLEFNFLLLCKSKVRSRLAAPLVASIFEFASIRKNVTNMLQYVAVCHSVSQCVAVWCSASLCVAVCCLVPNYTNALLYVAVCCSVSQCVAVSCSVLLGSKSHESNK